MMAPDKTDVKISPVPVAFTGIRGTEYVITVSVKPSYTAIVASVSEGTLVIITSSGPNWCSFLHMSCNSAFEMESVENGLSNKKQASV